MKIKKGTTRIVVIFKYFVIKIAIISWRSSLRSIFVDIQNLFVSIKKYGLKRHCLKRLIRNRKRVKEEEDYLIRKSRELNLIIIPFKKYEVCKTSRLLFDGIMANWNEFLFYRRTKNIFVMTTYFSFFGLFNIQKRGEVIDFWGNRDIWVYICHNSLNLDQPFCDSHSFAEVNNFCLDGDMLKMLDYGSRHVHNFIKLNGENLLNNFIKPI